MGRCWREHVVVNWRWEESFTDYRVKDECAAREIWGPPSAQLEEGWTLQGLFQESASMRQQYAYRQSEAGIAMAYQGEPILRGVEVTANWKAHIRFISYWKQVWVDTVTMLCVTQHRIMFRTHSYMMTTWCNPECSTDPGELEVVEHVWLVILLHRYIKEYGFFIACIYHRALLNII